MASKLDTAANIATVLVAIAVGGVIAQRYRTPSLPTGPNSYAVGEDISQAVPVDFGVAERTAVIAVQEGCHFCEESMPFYRRLITERNRRKSDVRIVFAAPVRDTTIQASLASKGVMPDSVVHVEAGSKFRITATPTLLVADRAGRVTSEMVGELAPDQQQETMDKLFRTDRSTLNRQ
jgi:hypothetical protein